ncbi:hypothetical protein CMO89_02915 [Candidatus Woesearchaeota archaeon]|nr:hypothetical protein [Candidatus Woesearchaeota archaeon]|tara:strand:+ start:2517 stop:3302 length:786 start_codon:yes stop_codon:yes gene_type:complete
MIIDKAFLSRLKDFGLNSYECKLWTALLSRGISTAGELSEIANVPRSRSYDVLESLEKKGFIIMKLGKPIKYIAVKPEEVIERVKKNVEKQASENISLIDNIRSTNLVKELTTLYSQGIEKVDPMDFSGSFKSRDSIYSHMETMIKNANKSIIINTSEAGLKRKLRAFSRLLEKANKKGIGIRVGVKSNDIKINVPKHIELRKSNINARFCIVDGKEFIFMLSDDKEINPGNDVGVWVNTSFFASAVQDFFENEWKKMGKI